MSVRVEEGVTLFWMFEIVADDDDGRTESCSWRDVSGWGRDWSSCCSRITSSSRSAFVLRLLSFCDRVRFDWGWEGVFERDRFGFPARGPVREDREEEEGKAENDDEDKDDEEEEEAAEEEDDEDDGGGGDEGDDEAEEEEEESKFEGNTADEHNDKKNDLAIAFILTRSSIVILFSDPLTGWLTEYATR